MAAQKNGIVFVVWGTAEIVLFAGLIFGWASLVYVYKAEGFFRETCQYILPPASPPDHNNHLSHNVSVGAVISYTGEVLHGSHDSTNGTSPQDGYHHVPPQHMLPIVDCSNQDEHFNLVYTLATVINGVSLFAAGWLFDKYGTRICRVTGIVVYLLGTLMAAFATASSSLLLYPAMVSLALGGYFVLLTNMQLGNLLPDKRSTIIALHCGAYDSSAFMLVLVKVAWEAGVSVRASFLLLTALYSLFIVSTFLFMPAARIPHPLPPNYRLTLACRTGCNRDSAMEMVDKPSSDQTENHNHKHNDAEMDKELEKKELSYTEDPSTMPLNSSDLDSEEPSFLSLAMTWLYAWDVIWLCCHRFASWSYVGRLNPALNRLAGSDKHTVSRYTSVYALMQFFGIFIAPLSGRLMDRKPKQSSGDVRVDKVSMCTASFVLDCSVGLLLAVITCIPVLPVQYAAFVLHVIHRACLYGPNTAFIAQAFPAKHFGKLFGFTMSFAAAFSLLQYPIFVMVQDKFGGNPLTANVFTLILMIISYGHPIYIHYWTRQQRRQLGNHRSTIYKPAEEPQEEVSPLKPDVET